MPRNRSSTFWLSYSDLMTSLFFIMLVLFIVCVVKMKGINDQLDKEVNAKEEQLRKIEELNNSIKEIDNKYFAYDEQFKRHTLKDIEVSFNTYSSNIYDIEQEQLDKLLKAGLAIAHFMNSAKSKIPEAQYMLIIEGQSSKDYYTLNSAAFFLVRRFYMLRCLFGALYVDMRIIGASWVLPKHEIPHPNQWGI